MVLLSVGKRGKGAVSGGGGLVIVVPSCALGLFRSFAGGSLEFSPTFFVAVRAQQGRVWERGGLGEGGAESLSPRVVRTPFRSRVLLYSAARCG